MARIRLKRQPPQRLERGVTYTVVDTAGRAICLLTIGGNRQMEAAPLLRGVTIRETARADDRQNEDCCGK